MAPSPAKMTAEIYRQDLVAFIHRSFLELNPAVTFEYNWHLELIAQSLEDVAYGNCKRLIINVPPRHLLHPSRFLLGSWDISPKSRWRASLTPKIFPTLWRETLVASWTVHFIKRCSTRGFLAKETP